MRNYGKPEKRKDNLRNRDEVGSQLRMDKVLARLPSKSTFSRMNKTKRDLLNVYFFPKIKMKTIDKNKTNNF